MVSTTADVMRLKLPTDEMILQELLDGRNLAANMAAEIGRSRNYVNQRMPHLRDYGLVERVGPVQDLGLYELTDRGEAALQVIDRYDEVEDFEALVERELGESTNDGE
jgi:DNA-binding HxlR family transcriptional regulator